MDSNLERRFRTESSVLMNPQEFIKKFNEENDPCIKARELHSVIKSFSSHTEIKQVEEESIFFQLISKIPELFEELVCNYDIDHKNKAEKGYKLQNSILCLETVLMCLKCVKAEEQHLLFLQSSLTVLYKGYSHCKECETIYGEQLEEFKDQLANFFNKMQNVQNAILLELSELLKKKLHSTQFHLIISISKDMYKLCDLVFNLDPTIAIELYKTLIELLENYKEIGPLDLQIDLILSTLISETLNMTNEFKLILKTKQQVLISECRIFLFKLNLIRKIVNLFSSCINTNIQCITQLALHLYELLISCYHHVVQENGVSSLLNLLTNTVKPMLSSFSIDTAFLSSVLLLNFKEISSEQQMAHLLLKLFVISILHQKQDQIEIPERIEIFQNICLLLQASNSRDEMMLVSIKIPFSLFNQGKNLLANHQPPEVESVSLYQHTYIHVAEYCKKISDSDLEKLENFVVDVLNSSVSYLVFLLISDIWIHRLRCSSTANLLVRCTSLSERCLKMPMNNLAKLLLKRMMKFLPPDCKKKLFKQNQHLEPFLYKECKILCRYGAPQCNNGTQAKEIDVDSKISILLNELKEPDFSNNQKLIAKACCILELCAISVNALNIQEFLRFSEFAVIMFKSEIYEVQMSVLTFLRALNFKKFNDKDPLFSKVRLGLAMLYNETLSCKNYIVRLEALSLFCIMAQFTDIRITQEAIAKFPDLYPSVKAFVSEVPQTGFLSEEDKLEILKNN
ncbi:uncharacterized protein TNCT_446501 [Trichonephila clavata]|uniref:Uncharacterized protein n=1 Tax=Trichonephila clavata TaxID=2740835 RepID=A0A8X6H918_TRICU|nr:uncharacterized protein TNCT_446501 [Trichonephila clavata]